jgi:hypothetical protein
MPLLDDAIVLEAGRIKYRAGPHGARANVGNAAEANQQRLLSLRNQVRWRRSWLRMCAQEKAATPEAT